MRDADGEGVGGGLEDGEGFEDEVGLGDGVRDGEIGWRWV